MQPGDPNDDYPYGYVDAATACSQGGNSGAFQTVYYIGTLGNGTVLYNDSERTQNFNYAGSIFWYWIGGYRFTYTFGTIADYAACPTTTTIIATGAVNVYAGSIAYKFYSSEGSTGNNEATIYGTFESSPFDVPNLPANGNNINVTFYVDRVAPDGYAGDQGYVIWYLDQNQMDVQYFNYGDQVQKSYTMSINKDSVVVVTVQEG